MPRYYFNVFGNEDVFDQVGRELPNQSEARKRTVIIAMEVVKNFKVVPGENWQMEALDETGKIVGTMDFGIDERHSTSRSQRRG